MSYKIVNCGRRVGKSWTVGYFLWDRGDRLELQGCTTNAKMMRQSVSIPKDPEQMLILVRALLAETHGDLSARAILAEATTVGEGEP